MWEVFKSLKQFHSNFLIEQKRELVLIIISSGLVCLLEMIGFSIVPFLLNYALEGENAKNAWLFAQYGKNERLLYCGTLVSILFILKNIFFIFCNWVLSKLACIFDNIVCKKFLKKIETCSYRHFLKKNSDFWIDLFSTTVPSTISCIFQFCQLSIYICTLGLLSLVLFVTEFKLTCFIFLFLWISIRLFRWMISGSVAYISVNLKKYQRKTIENLEMFVFPFKELKLLDVFPPLNKTFLDDRSSRYEREYLTNFLASLFYNLLEMAIFGLLIIVLYNFTLDGQSPRQILYLIGVFSAAVFRIIPVLNRILSLITTLKINQKNLDEMNSVWHDLQINGNNQRNVTKKNTFNGIMRLENVSFSYEDSVVIRNVSISVYKHDFIGIVGRSGAGKTTLVDIILGLLHPTKGEYRIDDMLVTSSGQFEDFFGYVSQNPCIITGTVEENIAFGRKVQRECIERVMALAQLEEFTPETVIAEMGKNISGGQRQRIAIARALYGNPEVLVLDEATASLDVITEKKISDIINSLKGKCTIIAIAHRLGTLVNCNRIWCMKQGEIIADDTFKAVYQSQPEFKEIVDILKQSNDVFGTWCA